MATINNTTEEWRPVTIHRYAHLYSVSSLGRIRSEERLDPNRRSPRILKRRILVAPPDQDGYRRVILIDDGDRMTAGIHVLVAAAFIGERPHGMTVDHVNGIKSDNRAVNLRYLSPGDNTRAASGLGLMCHGERCHSARLTAADVVSIRKRFADGEEQAALAREHGITPRAITKVVRRLSWRHAP